MTRHEANPPAEDKIEAFAEDLGRILGTARARAEDWLAQKHKITEQLVDIRDTATSLLRQLGHESAAPGKRRGRPPGSGRKTVVKAKRGPGRPKGSGRKRRVMSAEARKAISDAQKKRWAKAKGGATE
jgi:hypothetical protein